MHEGHHGIVEEAPPHHTAPGDTRWVARAKVYGIRFAFPVVLLALILMGLAPAWGNVWLNPTLVAAVAGAATIAWTTAVEVWRSRRITAGVLVVVAMAATLYLHDARAAAIVAFMMILGESVEDVVVDSTRRAIRSLVNLVPDTATVWRDGVWTQVRAWEVWPGERVLARAGERVPVDGAVVAGSGAVDESSITGESVPGEKDPGCPVYAGTVVQTGALEIETGRVGQDTTLGRIVAIVREVQASRGATQRVADRFASWFTPIILVVAAAAYLVTGELVRAAAVLVTACPCALVLATPTAVLASVGGAARRGVIIRGGAALEAAAAVTTVVFDKTGTLTTASPSVVEVEPFSTDGAAPGGDRDDPGRGGAGAGGRAPHADPRGADTGDRADAITSLMRRAAAAESHSSHPFARAIVARAEELGISIPEPEDFSVTRQSVTARLDGELVQVGGAALWRAAVQQEAPADGCERGQLAKEREAPRTPGGADGYGPAPSWAAAGEFMQREERQGRTPLLVMIDGRPVAGIAVAGRPREGSQEAVCRLRRAGAARILVLSGDAEASTRSVAEALGVDEYRSGMMPEEKLEMIRRMRQNGQGVAMVGDGVNDGPALAAADLGIAMGAAGSEVAIESAHVVLMGDDLLLVPDVLQWGRRTVTVIKQNIWVFAVAVNLVGMALAWAGILTPVAGAVLHNVASAAVVANSARLLGYRPRW
ncbi:MAG: cation-translocating P-type ATPase [Bacillota bacterium]|nr:cation-translocating P-type ATPase [Bacillota bacterium]